MLRLVRCLLMLIAAVVVCLAQAPPEKSALTGRVVSAATGAPLKKVAVWLEAFTPARGVTGAPSVASASTDADGRFTLEGVDPGAYYLVARRVGYLDQGYGASGPDVVGVPLSIAAGETRRDLVLQLTPQSLLYGKVVDEDGDPLPNAAVEAWRVSYAGGKRHLSEAAASDSQDDGSFVIGNLAPGRYYLSAGFRDIRQSMPPGARPERERYVVTYFPNAADAAGAAPVEVNPGGEVRGLAIHLRRFGVFHIRGRVVRQDTGAAVANQVLQLARVETDGAATHGVTTNAEGRFEFEGVLPGKYRIATDNSVNLGFHVDGKVTKVTSANLLGRAMISVTDSDIEDAVLPVGIGVTITGRFKGAAPGARMALVPAESADVQPLAASAESDGAFEISSIVPDVYMLEAGGLPEGSYVKSATFSGRPVRDGRIDLSSGAGGELLVEVSPDAGELRGAVRSATGDPAPGATVQIWPAVGEDARTARTDARGEFRFPSLPPGDYRVAAWQDLDDDLAQYPPFRARFEADAARTKIAERSHERVELTAIGRDAIQSEAAKLK
jgi:protocatechuate 3,4-dioxygenase beta subunit